MALDAFVRCTCIRDGMKLLSEASIQTGNPIMF
jgi:hypothetical protein